MLPCITMLDVKEVTVSSCNVSLLFSLFAFWGTGSLSLLQAMLGTVCSRAACRSTWIIFLNDCSETYRYWIRKRKRGCGKGKKLENLEKEEILSISTDISACQRSRGQARGWGKQGCLLLPGSTQDGGHAPKRKSCMSQADCWDRRALTEAPS